MKLPSPVKTDSPILWGPSCFLRWPMEMATHSSVLAWRIPGTGKHGGLPSMVRHDWSDLPVAVAAVLCSVCFFLNEFTSCLSLCVSLNSFCDETSRRWTALKSWGHVCDLFQNRGFKSPSELHCFTTLTDFAHLLLWGFVIWKVMWNVD